MERQDLSDRRFDVLLERLDRIGDELAKMNRRLDHDEHFVRMTRELASLNESLQALAYAALGQQAPQVRRGGRAESTAATRSRLVAVVAVLSPTRCRARRWSRGRSRSPREARSRPSTTIGLFQWPPPQSSVATSLPVAGT